MINEPITDWKNWKDKCIICYNKIDTNKEQYVKLIDMKGKKEMSHCIYHLNCWQNRFSVTSENMNKLANEWLSKITDLSGGKQVVEFKG
jgi:ssRNA-specific RNase YbeY (16S rRNA maturation enzyme)